MADVTIRIGDRYHLVACRDGEEDQVQALGARLDERWPAANRAAAGAGGERAMLFVALMLADALNEAEHRPPTPGSANAATLEKLADRLEGLAIALEHSGQSA
jgi:cell division protein ZapA